MTIKEAEKQYYSEVENYREQHIKHAKKQILIWNIIGAVIIVVGLILTIVGFTTPPEITSWGYEIPFVAELERVYGVLAMCSGSFCIIFWNISLRMDIKKGPKNFLPQIKNLYLNYLKCDDMGIDEKEFFKQKLEEIRNMELINAIHRTSANVSAAIIFSSLNK